MLSALKQAEDRPSIIVRLFNPGDEDAHVSLRLDARIAQAFAVNFLEERQASLPIQNDRVAMRLTPKQIGTIELMP